MNKDKYFISHVRDIRTLVEIEYLNKTKDVLEFGELNNIEDRINFEQSYRPIFKIININKFPHSKRVNLYSKDLDTDKRILIREDTNPRFYDLLEKFSFGSFVNGRETKYKNVFLVYEALEKNPDYKFIAVRNAISHPELTNNKALTELRFLFGTERIDLKKKKHNQLFKELYIDLEKRVHNLLVNEIIGLTNPIQIIGDFSIF